MDKKVAKDIDEYISWFPTDVQVLLQQMRETIKSVAADAEERISYQMPSFHLNGTLVYFAAYKNHIGFYPTGTGIKAFESHLSGFKYSKGAIQFPLDGPLPLELVKSITEYKVKENLEKKVKKK